MVAGSWQAVYDDDLEYALTGCDADVPGSLNSVHGDAAAFAIAVAAALLARLPAEPVHKTESVITR